MFEDLEIKLAMVATEIEKTSLIDRNQRDTLMGLGKAAMQVQIQNLIRMVDDFVCEDDRA